MVDLSVIIPTYNEKENIRETITGVLRVLGYHNINGEIIVVDDNSPDGTADIVRKMTDVSNVHVIVRKSDKGLSQSVVEGFTHAKADILLVMDADGSHPVKRISDMYNAVRLGSDIAVGSRYTQGGEIRSWSFYRRCISFGATALAKILFPDVSDPVSGFFAIHRDVIKDATLRPSGYKIFTEILGKGKYQSVKEIPYQFVNRKTGKSKLGLTQIFEYVIQLADIAVTAAQNRDTPVWDEMYRAAKFAAVGGSGILVNLMSLYLIVDGAGINYLLGGVIAIEISILWNFAFNDGWTFATMRNKPFKKRLVTFHAVSVGGMIINLVVLGILTTLGVWYLLSELIGIFVAFAWNFVVNRRKTWG